MPVLIQAPPTEEFKAHFNSMSTDDMALRIGELSKVRLQAGTQMFDCMLNNDSTGEEKARSRFYQLQECIRQLRLVWEERIGCA